MFFHNINSKRKPISYIVFTILTEALVLIVKPRKFSVERPYRSVCGPAQIRIDAECLTRVETTLFNQDKMYIKDLLL